MIELLEPRVAPASVLTFTDVDGDRVTITASRGDISDKGTFLPIGSGQQLTVLDLTSAGFQGASITTIVSKGPLGDGLVNIGFINATGIDLASIQVKGDLGQIEAGDANTGTLGLGLLDVRTIGRFGLSTQGGGGDLDSVIGGALSSLRISGDFAAATLNVTGGATPENGRIGSIVIGGTLSGAIASAGDIGSVRVGGDLLGGLDAGSGSIISKGKIGPVNIGGSVIGGAGNASGGVASVGDIGPVKIGRDIVGAAGIESGQISSDRNIASVTVGGSVRGGSGSESGNIASALNMGPVKITGDVIGGSGGNSGLLVPNFFVKSVDIGGSLIGGSGALSGRIIGDGSFGPIKIGGSLIGGSNDRAGRIEATALASITIGGSLLGGSGPTSGNITSYTGDIGPVNIGGDIIGGTGNESGKVDAGAKLSSIRVGGSVLGGTGNQNTIIDPNNVRHEGQIFAAGDMGQVTIGHDLEGGSGQATGQIFTVSKLAGITAGGSLSNGSEVISGARMGPVKIAGEVADSRIVAGGISGGVLGNVTIGDSVLGSLIQGNDGIGAVKIGGDLQGGDGPSTGRIASDGGLVSVTIGGSLIGGKGVLSGSITVSGNIGAVKIGGDLRGGSISDNEPSLEGSGYITGARIASVFIGGSIITGIDTSPVGDLTHNASIRVENDIGPITVKGSLIGNSAPGGTTPVIISARGQAVLPPGARSDIAIASLTVDGRVERAEILAGFAPDDPETVGSNGNASIGVVKVGGDWIASSISAGVQDGGLPGFGTEGDTVINNATDAIIARIASITIQGIVIGASGPSVTHFGFTAQQIGSFKSLGFVAPLTAGTDAPINVAPLTNDVTIREV